MNKEIKMKIGTKIIKLINGTPHNLKFEDGSLLEGNIELAKIITASPSELKIDEFRVRTTFIPNPKALDYLNHLDNDTYVITSIIGLEINHPKLISPITTPETTRLPPDQKICFKTKWNAKGNENENLVIEAMDYLIALHDSLPEGKEKEEIFAIILQLQKNKIWINAKSD